MTNRINNIEEMTNKVIEYIHATSPDMDDYQLQCMAAAAKFLLASFSFNRPIELSNDQIMHKCAELADIIINFAHD